MQKSLIYIIILSLVIISCGKEKDPFLIERHNIGHLTDSTQVKDLKTIFSNDSIVNYNGVEEFTRNMNNINVMDKKGNALLTIFPQKKTDSTSVISSIRILDPRYKTEKGISLASNFKDIESAYTITKIDNLINTMVVSVKEIDAAFTIDKNELPSNLRFDRSIAIEASQIPDNAKIKYFFMHWN